MILVKCFDKLELDWSFAHGLTQAVSSSLMNAYVCAYMLACIQYECALRVFSSRLMWCTPFYAAEIWRDVEV